MNKPCLLWTGCTDRNGYGLVTRGGKTYTISKWTYEQSFGVLPLGMEVDHRCNVRNCYELSHLEAVTKAENSRRASERQTHCKHGHEYNEENTRRDTRGHRYCGECDRQRLRSRRAA